MDRSARAEVNGLAIASLIFGALSILTCWTIFIPVPLVLLAFMFALLSRGNKKKCGVAVAGTILGIVGLVLTFVVIVSVHLWMWQLYNNAMAFVIYVVSYVRSIVNRIQYCIYSVYHTIQSFFNMIYNTINFYLNAAEGFMNGIDSLIGGLFR